MEINTALHYSHWLQKHPRTLARNAGQWVAIHPQGGIFASSDDAHKLYLLAKKKYSKKIPFIYKVPRLDEGPYVL